jgi:hypothetical protein
MQQPNTTNYARNTAGPGIAQAQSSQIKKTLGGGLISNK